jgi:hypothetical protein
MLHDQRCFGPYSVILVYPSIKALTQILDGHLNRSILEDGRLALVEALRPMSWCPSSCPKSMFVWGIVSERNLHISNVRMMPMAGVRRSEVCLEQGGRSVSP